MRIFGLIVKLFIPIAIICFAISLLYKWNYIQHEERTPGEFQVPTLRAGYDADGDKVDDMIDIVNNVKDYANRHPQYGYKEYVGGYPNDNRGVAVDLVTVSLRDAGYDMQKLVWNDIELNPEVYPKDHGKKNVAFRKIENLKTFMSRYFTSYTTEYDQDKKDWQAGDIIFFEKGHVAIVADKFNTNGVRFIFHHFWAYQSGFMQDVLETNAWGKITGHYRVNKSALSPRKDDKKLD